MKTVFTRKCLANADETPRWWYLRLNIVFASLALDQPEQRRQTNTEIPLSDGA